MNQMLEELALYLEPRRSSSLFGVVLPYLSCVMAYLSVWPQSPVKLTSRPAAVIVRPRSGVSIAPFIMSILPIPTQFLTRFRSAEVFFEASTWRTMRMSIHVSYLPRTGV